MILDAIVENLVLADADADFVCSEQTLARSLLLFFRFDIVLLANTSSLSWVYGFYPRGAKPPSPHPITPPLVLVFSFYHRVPCFWVLSPGGLSPFLRTR